jgi:mono/diheme cytochrome c family protein
MSGKISLIVTCVALLTLTGCDQGAHSPRGFRLPEGDANNGQALFERYGCNGCHTVKGVAAAAEKEIDTLVALGGPVTLNKTYADLVTSVINPSHRISRTLDQSVVQVEGRSIMRSYNDVMTVADLIDIVAFLQPQYELVDVPRTRP